LKPIGDNAAFEQAVQLHEALADINSGFSPAADMLSPPRQIFFKFQFPDSAEGGLLPCGVGQSEFELAMTHRVITLEFVVPTVLAIALGVLLSIGAVYLTDRYLGPADQPEPYHSSASSR
jgi:hypothetical protein